MYSKATSISVALNNINIELYVKLRKMGELLQWKTSGTNSRFWMKFSGEESFPRNTQEFYIRTTKKCQKLKGL